VSLLASLWLSPLRPGLRRRFTPGAPANGRQELDPRPFGLDQAPLVDFCNHHNPRARPHDRLIPVSNSASVRSRAPLAGPAFARLADHTGTRDQSLA